MSADLADWTLGQALPTAFGRIAWDVHGRVLDLRAHVERDGHPHPADLGRAGPMVAEAIADFLS